VAVVVAATEENDRTIIQYKRGSLSSAALFVFIKLTSY